MGIENHLKHICCFGNKVTFHVYFISLSLLVELMFVIESLACLMKHMCRELDCFILFYFFTLNSPILLSIKCYTKRLLFYV